ncbi:unnamed protein product, partial [marine sediment metagenome]
GEADFPRGVFDRVSDGGVSSIPGTWKSRADFCDGHITADPILASSSIRTPKVLTTGWYMVVIPYRRCPFIYTNPCTFHTSNTRAPKYGVVSENMNAEVQVK